MADAFDDFDVAFAAGEGWSEWDAFELWGAVTDLHDERYDHTNEFIGEFRDDPVIERLGLEIQRAASWMHAVDNLLVDAICKIGRSTFDPETIYKMLYNHVADNRAAVSDELVRLLMSIAEG